MSTSLIVCETCGADEAGTPRKGEQFAQQLERLAQNHDVSVCRTRCLMACQRHCTAALRAHGKITYVLGGFTPDEDAAEALLDYATKYAASETGQVPFRTWPTGIKGKFIARIPVLDT
jgi:predicted metal-binding protein